MKALMHLNKYLWKYRVRLFLGILFIICSNFFAIYAPQLVREAFDLVKQALTAYQDFSGSYSIEMPGIIAEIFSWFGVDPSKYESISSTSELVSGIMTIAIALAVLYLVVALIKGIFLFFTRQTVIIMSRLVEYDLKNEIFDHYQKLSLSFYKKNNTGDLMNRISEDVSKVRMYLGPAIMYTLNLVVLFVLALAAMLRVNVELTLYVLAPLPILSLSIYYVSTIINKRSEQVQRQQSRLSTFVQEAFSGIRVLKAYTREKSYNRYFSDQCEIYREKQLSLVKVDALFMPAMILLVGLSTIITIYIGGLKAMAGEITIGNIAEFVIYVNMLTWPFASLGWVTSLVQRAAASQERINEFLHIQPDIYNPTEKPLHLKGKIEFRNVSFVYPESGVQALRNVSFVIHPGETMAIVGHTGSGKSTIANLICRNFDADSGEILIDDKPLREINLDDYRSHLGYVPQEVFLFSDTIKNNVAFGLDRDVEQMDRVIEATKDAYVYHNIMDFRDGFETRVGERGITLSGGQKQRISIARAIIRQPQILLFDDCLSAVDTETEEIILKNLHDLMLSKTTILISHRVSTVKNADAILVLENGSVIETGNHESLVQQNGVYADLYQKQLLEGEDADAETRTV